MTCGLSPDAAFQQFQKPDNPQVKLGASCRHLLAYHRLPEDVTENGITFRIGKRPFNYRDENTGRLVGQSVLAWFNPELPELLTVTDMNGKNAFCVERSETVPAIDAPRDLYERELRRIAAHNTGAKEHYRMLKTTFAREFRQPVSDRATAEHGATSRLNEEAFRARRREGDSLILRTGQKAAGLGRPLEAMSDRLQDNYESVSGMEEAERLHERSKAQAAGASPGEIPE